MSVHKSYLGDGVYVALSHDGSLVLTTENGVSTTNEIVLEDFVWTALMKYVRDVASAVDAENERNG